MHDSLEIFRLAGGLARHAAARQAIVASNTAHADTPGYRARDLVPFSESYANGDGALSLRATRSGHLGQQPGEALRFRSFDVAAPAAPNGNSVSLEDEMVKAAETRQSHDMALAVYTSALGILRSSLGRGR